MGSLIFLLVLLGLMYVALILPQQRRMRRHQELVSSLEEGDEVLTSAGIYGTIVGFDDDDPNVMLVEVADETVLRMTRSAVSEVAVEGEDEGEDEGDEVALDGETDASDVDDADSRDRRESRDE